MTAQDVAAVRAAPVAGTRTILANARLILADEVVDGSLVIEGESIAEIDPGRTVPGDAIDCGGDYLAPGLIELHTDNLERHMQPRPGVRWPHNAAIVAHDAELASVGITTVFDAMRVGSNISEARSKYGKYARALSRELLALRDRGGLRISHFLHLRAEICSETLVEELAEFSAEDRVGIVSLMDHTPEQRQFTDTKQLRTYLSGKYAMGPDEIDAHIQFQKDVSAQYGALHKREGVKRAGELGAILASHDDTTPDHVSESAGQGVGLAEFPTTLEAAQACHAHGIAVMMGAPNLVRGGSHSGNVAAKDLAERGLLDILSSDYAPASLLNGAVMLGEIWGNMARGLSTVTAAPARSTGLADRGTLTIGQRADLVRFNADHGAAMTRGLWVRGHRVA
ncbi:MAG: alpha-D-ribose 1-methylphosphonate 5-triphosphate diphosphatase [Pseudomonadota bacterium]